MSSQSQSITLSPAILAKSDYAMGGFWLSALVREPNTTRAGLGKQEV